MLKYKNFIMFKQKLKDIFFPHEKNFFRPHAFRHKCLSFYTLGLIITHYLSFGFALTGAFINNPNIFTKDIVSYTNEERKKAGLNELSTNSTLSKAAEEKLDHMLKNNYWDHKAPDGTEAWYFIAKEGYPYTFAGENLARGFVSAENTVYAWLNSSSHRENLLNNNYKDIGVAAANGKIDGKETTVIVQLFGADQPVGENSSEKVLTLGEQVARPTISPKNAFSPSNLPYLMLWLMIFIFMILDARVLKKLGVHKHKYHKYQLRMVFALNFTLLILLLLGFAYIT